MIKIASNSNWPSWEWVEGWLQNNQIQHKPSPLHQEKNLAKLFNAAIEFTNTWDKKKYIETLLSLGAHEKEAQEMANLAESRRIAAEDEKKAQQLINRLKLL